MIFSTTSDAVIRDCVASLESRQPLGFPVSVALPGGKWTHAEGVVKRVRNLGKATGGETIFEIETEELQQAEA